VVSKIKNKRFDLAAYMSWHFITSTTHIVNK